jgi:hypothetical protein
MDFLPNFLGTGLFVLMGIFLGLVGYGVAYVCGMPFDLSRFLVTCGIGGFLGTALLLWASIAAKPRDSRVSFEILVASLLWWAVLAVLVYEIGRRIDKARD